MEVKTAVYRIRSCTTTGVPRIAVRDLTKVADGIKGRAFVGEPLFIAAVIYLVLVVGMTQIQKQLERRLAKGDRR